MRGFQKLRSGPITFAMSIGRQRTEDVSAQNSGKNLAGNQNLEIRNRGLGYKIRRKDAITEGGADAEVVQRAGPHFTEEEAQRRWGRAQKHQGRGRNVRG